MIILNRAELTNEGNNKVLNANLIFTNGFYIYICTAPTCNKNV